MQLRRVNPSIKALLLASLLLVAWFVFFAWPPVHPLGARGNAGTIRPVALLPIDLEEPGSAEYGERPERHAARERAAVASNPRTGHERVRVHGRLARRGEAVSDYDLVFLRRGSGLDDEEEWDFTDEDGRYEVLLTPGRYIVVNDDEGPWTTNIDVPPVADLVLDIELPTGIVRGRVQVETGGAVAAARVHALRLADGPDGNRPADAITQALMARGGEARTLPDGSFELADLRPGDYLLTAEKGGVLTTPLEVVVTAAPIADLVLTLRNGSTLRGVVRGPGNEPVAMDLWLYPGTHLSSLTQLANSPEHFSNDAGEFVIAGLQPGPYVLFGRGETRTHDLALQAMIDFRAGEPPIELIARPCGELAITVLEPDGTPVRGAHVDLRANDGCVIPCSVKWLEEGPASDAAGRLVLDDVMPGWYRITAGARGRSGSPASAEVRSEQRTELALVLDSLD